MYDSLMHRYAAFVSRHSRMVIAIGALLTLLVGGGLWRGGPAQAEIGEVQIETPARTAQARIEQTYDVERAVESYLVIRVPGTAGNNAALSQAAIVDGLRFQQALRQDPQIAGTLQPDAPLRGFENLIGQALCAYDGQVLDTAAVLRWREAGQLPQARCPLAMQIEAIERMPAEAYRLLRDAMLDPDHTPAASNLGYYLPVQPDAAMEDSVSARAVIVSQRNAEGSGLGKEAIRAAQLAIEGALPQWFDDAFLYGEGITKAESTRAVVDSFLLVAPIACLLLIGLLVVALRAWLDIVLCVCGVLLVLLWLQGIQAWLAIPSTSILIAVPFLVAGLAIDYMLHVVMRYREQQEGGQSPQAAALNEAAVRDGMEGGLGGVLPALALAAFSTAIGFLANFLSPLASIRDFAVVSGLGIVSTFLIFSALMPAIKIECEAVLARRGWLKARWALGRAPGWMQRALAALSRCTVRHPWPVAATALVVGVGGLFASAGLETSFKRADFIPTSPPQWMVALPEPFAPGDYQVADNVDYLVDHFRLLSRLLDAEILVEGEVTAGTFLTAIETMARRRATESGALVTNSPASLLRLAAFHDRDFANAVAERDDDGDGLPDRDLATLYDQLFEMAPVRAAEVLHRVDGEYRTARLQMALLLNASSRAIAGDVRKIADHLSANAPVSAIATGTPIIAADVESALFKTLQIGFSVTLVVIAGLLAAVYGWQQGAYGLGILLLAPVVTALLALLGAMRLLDVPFNAETVVITSLAIGIGVDYSVHIGERFLASRERLELSLEERMEAVLTGTGGALLGSTATTACGFGVLALAISPPLQRFGMVTGMAIVLCFLACLIVLPALLVLRERFLERAG